MNRPPYPTDATDAEWELIRPLLPAKHVRGRPQKYDLREIYDAVRYVVRSGCAWRLLPHDFPKWRTVYNHFAAWRDSGVLESAAQRLAADCRTSAGKDAAPSVAVLDSASAKMADQAGERGYDGNKKANGRKRFIITDVPGLVLAVVVCAANTSEQAGGVRVLVRFKAGPAWTPPPGSIHPERHATALSDLRVGPDDIPAEMLSAFVPRFADIPAAEADPVLGLRNLLARTATLHNAATWLLENEPWDFAAVYYEALDQAGHEFMPFHPPRLPQVPEREFGLYRKVMEALYVWHDMMLARLLDLAGPETTVIVMSDHGFHTGSARPIGADGRSRGGPTAWHRPIGVLAMAGPGLKTDERIYGATLLDIAPTVLAMLGVPVGRDMDGRVLTQAFATPPDAAAIPSWDDRPGEAGLLPPEPPAADEADHRAALATLAALGYIAAPRPGVRTAAETARLEAGRNLASLLMETGRPGRAATVLEGLRAEFPDDRVCAAMLAGARLAQGRPAEARTLAEEVPIDAGGLSAFASLVRAQCELAGERPAEAMAHVHAALAAAEEPHTLAQAGSLLLRFRRHAEAERCFRRALEADPQLPGANYGLGRCLLALGRPAEAADALLAAVTQTHMFPDAHFALGVALRRLGETDRAVRALEVCLGFDPGHRSAQKYLAAVRRLSPKPPSPPAARA